MDIDNGIDIAEVLADLSTLHDAVAALRERAPGVGPYEASFFVAKIATAAFREGYARGVAS